MKRTKQSTILNKYGGRFTMPGGFHVRVKILDKHDERDGIPGTTLAQYWRDEHLIELRGSRSLKQRRTDLEHELQHCCVDWVDHYMRKSRVVPPRKKVQSWVNCDVGSKMIHLLTTGKVSRSTESKRILYI